jgi:hypothetical protein
MVTSSLPEAKLLIQVSEGVSFLFYTRYAVVHQTGRFTRYTAESPAAAWSSCYSFFTKIHVVNFCEKDRVSSSLPEAKLLSRSVKA